LDSVIYHLPMSLRDQSGILIPAYNAAAFIAATLRPLLDLLPPERIAVVDDGSTDGTGDAVERLGVTCLRQGRNRGKGTALMAGMDWASGKGWTWAVTLDADGQHSPADLAAFWEAPVAGDTGIVVGRRALAGTSMPPHRRFSNWLTTRMTSALAGRPVHDAQCGYRMYRLEAVKSAGLPPEGRFEWEAQALVLCCRAGWNVLPVDIATLYTDNGSHMRIAADTLRFLRMYWRLAWTR
jgi:glycosyltransferase involved in cell wall biosynthesis